MQRAGSEPVIVAGLQSVGQIAQRGKVGDQVVVGLGPDRRDREHRGTPAFAPVENLPGVAALDGVPERDRGEFGPLGGGQYAQFGGAEGSNIDLDQIQALPAGGQHRARSAVTLVERGLGQPTGAAPPQATVPGSGRDFQVASGFGRVGARESETAGQEVGLGCEVCVEPVEFGTDPPAGAQQACRPVAARIPGLEQHKLRARRPPRTLLAAEQLQRVAAAASGQIQSAGGVRCQSGAVQQLRAARRRATLLFDPVERVVDLGQCLSGQAGGQLHQTPVGEQVRLEDAQLFVHPLCVVEVQQRRRQVTASERCGATRLTCVCVLGLLTALREQLFAVGIVLVGTVDRTHREQHHRPVGECPSLPDQVAGVAQQHHRLLGIGQRLVVLAEYRAPHPDAPNQDAAGHHTGAAAWDRVERGHTPLGVTGHHQGHAETGQNVRLVVSIRRLAGMPVRRSELGHRLVDVAEVAVNDTRRLMGCRGLGMGWGVRENVAGDPQGVSGPRECKRVQFVGVHGKNRPPFAHPSSNRNTPPLCILRNMSRWRRGRNATAETPQRSIEPHSGRP